jgi:hypothetical protein
MEQVRLDKGEFADNIEKRLKTFMLRYVQVFRELSQSYTTLWQAVNSVAILIGG